MPSPYPLGGLRHDSPASVRLRKTRIPALCPYASRKSPPKNGMKMFGISLADIRAPYLVSLKCSLGSLRFEHDTTTEGRPI